MGQQFCMVIDIQGNKVQIISFKLIQMGKRMQRSLILFGKIERNMMLLSETVFCGGMEKIENLWKISFVCFCGLFSE